MNTFSSYTYKTKKKSLIVKLLVAAFLFLMFSNAFGQSKKDNYFRQWKAEDLKRANTAEASTSLSTQEKNLIFYTNLMRINPPLFAKTYLQDFYEKQRIIKGPGYLAIVKHLNRTAPMEPLTLEEDLRLIANKHAKDMGLSGRVGHKSTNSEFYADRTEEILKDYDQVKETCQYGFAEALDILGDLIIDSPFEEFDERSTLLDPNLKHIGVAIYTHIDYDFNCVMELGGNKITTPVTVEQIELPLSEE